MTTEDMPAMSRPGSGPDLSRRMDNIERRQNDIETEVRTLALTVGRVEQNQNHAAELNKLRFDAIDTGVKTLTTDLTGFMARIDGIITGEVETAQTKQAAAMVADYVKWRGEVDRRLAALYTEDEKERIEERLERHDRFETEGRLIARLVVVTFGGNVLAVAAALWALIH